MTRLPDWRTRLTAYLAETARARFEPGVHDCALFAAGAVEAMTGKDPAARYRGKYDTIKRGLARIRRTKAKSHIGAARALYQPTSAPQAGDLAVVITDEGDALGVVQGAAGVYVAAPIGWAIAPLSLAAEFLEVP